MSRRGALDGATLENVRHLIRTVFPNRRTAWLLITAAVFVFCHAPGSHATPPSAPIADAGPSRYAGRDPIRLDGTRSFDPGGIPIVEYRWTQLSGPDIEISDADTANPTLSGFSQNLFIQTVEIELVVSDGVVLSEADTVEVIIVPRMAHRTMSVLDPPFRPQLPTLITFGGGDCIDGSEMRPPWIWRERFNIITGRYFSPYADHAYQILVLLSELAPEYDQPIQTIGFSTGGNPASVIANVINRFFPDPRYAVNRMTLLDTWCDPHLDRKIADFTEHPVAGEPAWAEVYRSFPEPIPGALNISFHPGGGHSTPSSWFFASMDADTWSDGDMYSDGVTAGFFLSVGGPARNLQINTEGTDYYFECPHLAVGCLQQRDSARHSGLILEPVTLIGPADGTAVWPQGTALSCEESRHATSYEVLFGPDPTDMAIVVSETPTPPEFIVDGLPFSPTYWTIRVRDSHGSTIFAPPRSIHSTDIDPARRSGRRVSPDR